VVRREGTGSPPPPPPPPPQDRKSPHGGAGGVGSSADSAKGRNSALLRPYQCLITRARIPTVPIWLIYLDM
jgi:hypothetical protein